MNQPSSNLRKIDIMKDYPSFEIEDKSTPSNKEDLEAAAIFVDLLMEYSESKNFVYYESELDSLCINAARMVKVIKKELNS